MIRNLVLTACLASLAVTLAAQESKVKKVPLKKTAVSGEEMYVNYCAACHGKAGKGDGPAASALKVPAPDLTTLSRNNKGKFPDLHVYNVIRGDVATPAHGSKEMPVWGSLLSSISSGNPSEVDLRITNLTKYIEKLQVK
jgi:mono/diheme cytochrome c family protein